MQTVALTRLEAINVRRRRLGWSQSDHGERAGYSASYAQQVLKGAVASEVALDALEAALTAAESASPSDS